MRVLKLKTGVKSNFSKMKNGKNGKHYLEKPLFCAKKMPKFGTNVVFFSLATVFPNEYNTFKQSKR